MRENKVLTQESPLEHSAWTFASLPGDFGLAEKLPSTEVHLCAGQATAQVI